ncbi:MAG: protein jag [Bdellovibrionales bacterium]
MTGFLGKLFGKKRKEDSPEALVEDVLAEVIRLGGFELSFEVKTLPDKTVHVDVFGEDEELLTTKEGQLLDAFQLYVRRAVQHQLPEGELNVNIDCANFREQANEALIALADKLKEIALTKGKSVYFRALPPKDRKVVHQYLAEDGRVKSRSVGEGHFKKIKIYPIKAGEALENEAEGQSDGAFESR